MQNNRKVGSHYEQQVADWLSRRGYEILARNFRCRLGEIDLIAKKDDCIAFVEVKYRRSAGHGAPEEAVDFRKQQRISNVAAYYLHRNHCPVGTSYRFDVAAVTPRGIRYIENAFSYCGRFFQ